MAQTTTDLARLAAKITGRLRMLQVEMADSDRGQREQILKQELDRQLAGAKLSPGERGTVLKELEERFPSWDQPVAVGGDAPVQSGTDAAELNDPSFLIARLIELAEAMPAKQKLEEVIDPLAKAGLVKSGVGIPPDALAALKKKLGIAADKAVDLPRLVQLVETLADCVQKVSRLIYTIWCDGLGGRKEKGVRVPATPLDTIIREFITGSREIGSKNVVDDVDELRSLVAAMVSSVATLPAELSGRYTHLRPGEIELAVSTSMFKGKSAACWDKYSELATVLSPSSMDREIKELLVRETVKHKTTRR